MTEPSPQQFIKRPQQVKEQIERWYLRYYNITYEQVTLNRDFTLFDNLSFLQKATFLQRINLANNELPVLALQVNDNNLILNTTHRFININGEIISTIAYTDFDSHRGFKCLDDFRPENDLIKQLKKDGYFQEFGLRCKSGKIIYWTIQTGNTGHAFWNVTNKCELIGRKYIITEAE